MPDYSAVMKRILGIIIMAICLLSGCSKARGPRDWAAVYDPLTRQYTAIVTVRQDASGQVFFQFDKDLILYPDYYPDPFVRDCRIICEVSWKEGSSHCHVEWMDYLQEGVVGAEQLPEGDPVEIEEDWMTFMEDAYLTLHYFAFWGDGKVAHTLSLVTGENPEDPYEVRLVHLSNGDPPLEKADALVYFDLNSLPPTGDEDKFLTIKWKNSTGGFDSRRFLFKSRQ